MEAGPTSFGVEEARRRLPELLERAAKGEHFEIRRHRKPMAALVPLSQQHQVEPLPRPESIQNLMGLKGSHQAKPSAPPRFQPRQLSKGSRIALDGSALVSFLKGDQGCHTVLEPILQGIAQGTWQGVISSLSLMEVLREPISQGHEALVQRYLATFANPAHWLQQEVDADLVLSATRLRTQEPRLANLQAIELATAIRSETTVLVTADAELAQTALHPVLSARRPS
ncbi:hypothetical protein [Vulcanococcus sp.]|uniref:hypothetical protein n=1 Tax=Vulcanococcus sp. TaxID=2856995 RepID=UPI003BFA8C5E